jgi:hypothetical protein
MTVPVAIVGSADRIGRDFAVDAAVSQCVSAALAAALLALADIDAVVTTGSDALDGGMVGVRAGIAGGYGRELLSVPSSGGHAFAAAVSLVQSGQARNVIVAGWGEGTKFALRDGRGLQADPFYARPVGADAATMAALQAQRLVADGVLTVEDLAAYGAAMRCRAEGAGAGAGGIEPWLQTQWTDGACAIVLQTGEAGVRVTDIGTSFRGYTPPADDLDPGGWISMAMPGMENIAGEALTSAGAALARSRPRRSPITAPKSSRSRPPPTMISRARWRPMPAGRRASTAAPISRTATRRSLASRSTSRARTPSPSSRSWSRAAISSSTTSAPACWIARA